VTPTGVDTPDTNYPIKWKLNTAQLVALQAVQERFIVLPPGLATAAAKKQNA